MGACTQPGNLMIVTEYMERGSVYDLLHDKVRPRVLPSRSSDPLTAPPAEHPVVLQTADEVGEGGGAGNELASQVQSRLHTQRPQGSIGVSLLYLSLSLRLSICCRADSPVDRQPAGRQELDREGVRLWSQPREEEGRSKPEGQLRRHRVFLPPHLPFLRSLCFRRISADHSSTPLWMAPEVLLNKEYDESADLYSYPLFPFPSTLCFTSYSVFCYACRVVAADAYV
jgi:hypothetical protein